MCLPESRSDSGERNKLYDFEQIEAISSEQKEKTCTDVQL